MSGIYGGDASENYGPFSYLLSFALSKKFFITKYLLHNLYHTVPQIVF